MENGDSQNRRPNVWMISGCSRGLGRSIVSAALARGDKVITTARDVSQLSYARDNENVELLSLDITAPQDVLNQKIQEAILIFGRIDVLVNNAGYVASGVWEETSSDEVKQEFETNFFGALNLTRAVLPHMRHRRTGAILLMGSIPGWHAVAAGGPYSQQNSRWKDLSYLKLGAADALGQEVNPLGIRVHLFVLGRFRTDILDQKYKRGNLNSKDDFADYEQVKKQLVETQAASHKAQPGDPLRAAERIVDVARLENLREEQARNLPLRIPLGAEATAIMRGKCQETLNVLDNWAEFSSSADYPEASETPACYK